MAEITLKGNEYINRGVHLAKKCGNSLTHIYLFFRSRLCSSYSGIIFLRVLWHLNSLKFSTFVYMPCAWKQEVLFVIQSVDIFLLYIFSFRRRLDLMEIEIMQARIQLKLMWSVCVCVCWVHIFCVGLC